MVRPSGTEKLLRVMAKGDDEALVKGIADQVAAAGKPAGLGLLVDPVLGGPSPEWWLAELC